MTETAFVLPDLYIDAELQAQLAAAMQVALAQLEAFRAIERSFPGQDSPPAKPGDTVPASGGALDDQPKPILLPGPFLAGGAMPMPFLYDASLTGADFAAPHIADTIPALGNPAIADSIIPGDAFGLSDGTWLSFASLGEFNHDI